MPVSSAIMTTRAGPRKKTGNRDTLKSESLKKDPENHHKGAASPLPLLNRFKSMLASDEHRVAVQTTAAVLMAFVAILFMGRENMTWGVFSALFVVQASVGGTLRTGLERVLGAVLGAALGVAAVLLPLDGLVGTLIALFIGVSIMS